MTDVPKRSFAHKAFLFIMLVLCTLLHADSVAEVYVNAVRKTLAAIGLIGH